MALGNSQNKIYLSVADGKIVQRVKEGTPGAIPRPKKDGEIVHELRFGYITGNLVGISIRTSQYQGSEFKEWQFEISDNGENYQLSMMYDSRYATSFLYALCNPDLDLTQPITINPWMKVVNDKKKTACYLNQNNETVEWYFTKENQRGMPELKEVVFQGKARWDSFDRMQFLEKYVMDNVIPNIPKAQSTAAHAYVPSEAGLPTQAGHTDLLEEEDDLPF